MAAIATYTARTTYERGPLSVRCVFASRTIGEGTRVCHGAKGAGWSRQASTGLVGYARKDGTNASKAVGQYLETKQPVEPNLKALAEKIKSLTKPIVTKDDIKKLEATEIAEAQKRGVEEFKFDSNDDMLQAMGLTVTA